MSKCHITLIFYSVILFFFSGRPVRSISSISSSSSSGSRDPARSVIRRGDHVFRVGGDEFVVIFAPDPAGPRSACSSPPESIEQIASRFQHQVGSLQLPQIGLNAPGTLSISAGMVSYPWDGQDSEELLRKADQLALESKRSGKNVITFGPAARNQSDEFPPAPEDERDRTESE